MPSRYTPRRKYPVKIKISTKWRFSSKRRPSRKKSAPKKKPAAKVLRLQTLILGALVAVFLILCFAVPRKTEQASDDRKLHTHLYTYELTKPTCVEQGYKTYTCSCGDYYIADYIPTIPHEYVELSCQYCGQLSEAIAYIELSSEEDIYALGRIFAPEQTKQNVFGAGYDINKDLQRFVYPGNIKDAAAKIEYLSTSAYKLTADMLITLQYKKDATCFLGIGSVEYPFRGIFDGNGKTVILNTNGPIGLDSNTSHRIGLFGNTWDAKIANVHITVINDLLVNKCTEGVKFGALVGYANESQISNCHVVVSNSRVGVSFSNGEEYIHKAHVGGIAGESKLSIIRYSDVKLTDAVLCAQGYDVSKYQSMYAFFSVGGILGFSESGSDNTSHIGRVGTQLLNCKVTSNNQMQKDVIIASLEKGDEVTAGGLVGCAFNNFLAKNCSVDITKGNIVAQKTGTTDSATYGSNAGGIIGRLEHTGELNNCHVTGNYLNILSKSPENYSTAGGIVGYDVGPYHRDVISVNGCSVNGNGTTKIILEIKADQSINKWNALGGIAGGSSYHIKDCSVNDVTLVNQSQNVDKMFIGNICGIFNREVFWSSKTYFTPTRESGLKNCTYNNVLCDAAENATVKELIGLKQ